MIIKIHQNSEDSFAMTDYYELPFDVSKESLKNLVDQDLLKCKDHNHVIRWRGVDYPDCDGMCEVLETVGKYIRPEAEATIVIPCYSEAYVCDGDVEGR